MNLRKHSIEFIQWSMLIWLLGGVGCGPSGPQRYRISGSVTFDGQPLAIGQISFEPDAKGNGGGFAPIIDGKYDTSVDGRGHLGGQHEVRIVGFTPVGDPNNADGPVSSLFNPYDQSLELPTEATKLDFDVPVSLKLDTTRKSMSIRESANQ